MLSTIRIKSDVLDKEGDHITLKYKDEDDYDYIYQGEVNESNELHGYGKLWNNDYSYHGYFKNNKLCGKGTLSFTGNVNELNNTFSVTYEGEFSDNKKNGRGLEIYKNNEYYEGNFLNDFRHGKGILFNPNGVPKFDSFWELGRSVNTEEITEFYPNGNIKYKGCYNGQSKHGKGALYNDKGYLIFSGEFDNGLMLSGRMYYDNFIIFDGIFVDNYPNSGIFYHSNGIKSCEGKIVKGDKGYILIGESKIYDESSNLVFEGEMLNIYDYPNNYNLYLQCDLLIKLNFEISSFFNQQDNNFLKIQEEENLFKVKFGNGTLYYTKQLNQMSNNFAIPKK
jgi:antitoxin component YwqK of YwqJK toxin-antitoxin module